MYILYTCTCICVCIIYMYALVCCSVSEEECVLPSISNQRGGCDFVYFNTMIIHVVCDYIDSRMLLTEAGVV